MPTGSSLTGGIQTWFSWRSTKTRPSTTRTTSKGPIESTGGSISKTHCAATSSIVLAFEKPPSRKGIANGDTVILDGGNNNWFAAYAYWYFKVYGHRDVRLLDGGRKKWELDGRPLSTRKVTRPATNYVASEPVSGIRAHRDEVVEQIGKKSIVDVRSPEEFSGKILAPAIFPQEQPQVGGHVPTAVNVPWSKTAADDGTFRSEDELRALYKDAGLDDTKDIIVYCRIGERSAHSWFVLHELLGYAQVQNYDGSWVEYGSLIGVPVEA